MAEAGQQPHMSKLSSLRERYEDGDMGERTYADQKRRLVDKITGTKQLPGKHGLPQVRRRSAAGPTAGARDAAPTAARVVCALAFRSRV